MQTVVCTYNHLWHHHIDDKSCSSSVHLLDKYLNLFCLSAFRTSPYLDLHASYWPCIYYLYLDPVILHAPSLGTPQNAGLGFSLATLSSLMQCVHCKNCKHVDASDFYIHVWWLLTFIDICCPASLEIARHRTALS